MVSSLKPGMVVLGGTLTGVPTHRHRIQVTEDRERAAAPHLPAGLPRSQQVRELAIAGARHLAAAPPEFESIAPTCGGSGTSGDKCPKATRN